MTDNNELNAQEVQPRPDAPGRVMLKVTGILSIVVGSIWCVIVSLAVWIGITTGMIQAEGVYMVIGLFIATIIYAAFPALLIIMGIIGVKNCNNIEKANTLRVLGVVSLVVGVIFSATLLGIFATFNLLFIIVLSLILPVVYLYGAQKNLKAWKEKLAM